MDQLIIKEKEKDHRNLHDGLEFELLNNHPYSSTVGGGCQMENLQNIRALNYYLYSGDNGNGNENKLKYTIAIVTPKEADNIADWLIEKLHSPQNRAFYCKVAYKLSKPKIYKILIEAQEKAKTTPAQYFTFLAKKTMGE